MNETTCPIAETESGGLQGTVETGIVFRDGTLAIADHHANTGNATYVYEFDYTPPNDPAHLGSAHCAEWGSGRTRCRSGLRQGSIFRRDRVCYVEHEAVPA